VDRKSVPTLTPGSGTTSRGRNPRGRPLSVGMDIPSPTFRRLRKKAPKDQLPWEQRCMMCARLNGPPVEWLSRPEAAQRRLPPCLYCRGYVDLELITNSLLVSALFRERMAGG
jgi:hypothetical protein